jgi:hypothetical protein
MTDDLTLNNGQNAVYIGKDDWSRELFELDNKMQVVLVDGKLHTFDKEYGEPQSPLKNDYQPQIIPHDYNILYDFHNRDILKSMLEIESKEKLISGDIWLNIKHENFKEGLFLQVEAKELEKGNYSNDTFNVFAYENFLNTDNELETNYDKTIFKFEFNKSDIEKLDNKALNDIKAEMQNKPQAQELHEDKEDQSNVRRNK